MKKTIGLLFAFAWLSFCYAQKQTPNVLLIIADDLGNDVLDGGPSSLGPGALGASTNQLAPSPSPYTYPHP